MSLLRIGLVGAGLISEHAHIPAILSADSVSLRAIVEPNACRAEHVLSKFNLDTPVIPSIKEAAAELDAVVIATPNDSHCELALQSFNHGLHVFVEKPLAESTEKAALMVDTARRSGLVLMVGFCMRYWASISHMRNLITSGAFGHVKKFLFQYGAAGGWNPVSGYIMSRKSTGGGVLVVNGSHYLDRVLNLFGYPRELEYSDDAHGGSEANACAKLRFSSKSLGVFTGVVRVSKTVQLLPGSVVVCEGATLIHRDWRRPALCVQYGGRAADVTFETGVNQFSDTMEMDAYKLQLEDFTRKCHDSNWSIAADLDDALKSIRLTEELYSIRTPLRDDWYFPEGMPSRA